ncbi:hypothetical protein [Niabella aurantiaca]|uniref:hypothetical protein n=1 Tax=Niabella aurantiaca TaxID=379900 RepID=UPI00036B3A21|nr:hypothetical protein [Niabella aurantiaca]
MLADYTKRVLQAYEKKRAAGALSPRLTHPTPAKLKAECMAIYNVEYQRKDERMFSVFFGQAGDEGARLKAIKRCETDRFKPLVKFLRKKTRDTDDKNIELLAWLIGFEPRPYELGKNYDAETAITEMGQTGKGDAEGAAQPERPVYNEATPVSAGTGKEQDGPDKDSMPVFQPGGSSYPEKNNASRAAISLKIRDLLIAGALLVFAGIFIYRAGKDHGAAGSLESALPAQEACMYWAGDHYQQVSCSRKMGDVLVIALDTVRLRHFRKITRPDTITSGVKDGIWYVKVNGAIEFYTSDGHHPVDRHLRLKPLTDYIIKKYIHP